MKIVASRVGGVKLSDGSALPADGQLAGTPSVLFDAVAAILSEASARLLARDPEAAAIDFVRDAFSAISRPSGSTGEA